MISVSLLLPALITSIPFFLSKRRMAETCSDCSKWAEKIYWSHFQSIHFSQILRNGFEHQLAIPNKFTSNLRKKLPGTVTLKGPSGVEWNVGLIANDNSIFFKHGWQAFVNDHSLEENDLLVFKYNGESQFDVLIFDSQDMCEKEASYFVQKCGHVFAKDDGGFLTSMEEHNASTENVGCSSLEKSRDDVETMVATQVPFISPDAELPVTADMSLDAEAAATAEITPATTISNSKKALTLRTLRTKGSARRGLFPSSGQGNSDGDTEYKPGKSRKLYGLEYVSNRRPISQDEKKYTLQMAEAATSSEGFRVVMRPSHVYKRYYVIIPLAWAEKRISLINQYVFIRIGEKLWRPRLNYNKLRKCAALTSGWKYFAVDNNLEESDVCVFEPGGTINGTVVLDVKIFRVIQEFVALTMVSQTSSSAKRKKRDIEDERDEEDVKDEEEDEEELFM